MPIVSLCAIRFFEFVLRMDISAIAIFPFIFIHPDTKVTPRLINHERIHLRQQLEMLVIPFYVWYLIEYFTVGYEQNRFELEAYDNDYDLNYLSKRKWYHKHFSLLLRWNGTTKFFRQISQAETHNR